MCGAGSRSALIVLLKAGNRGHGDPLEESGASHVQYHWWDTMEETLSSTNTYTKQQWIAEQARVHPERVFTSVHHFIDGEWMREAYRRTRKDGAVGIDGVTAADYEKDLEANLDDLLGRMKSGRYFARPVRRHATPSWHSDVRRQGGAAGDPDASGTDLRGRLSAVLVRLPAWGAQPTMPCTHCARASWSDTCGG